MSNESPLPLIVSSPSGAGKTTLTNRLLQSVQGLKFSVSHTTRKPRVGESSGREYHFVSRSQFEQLVENDEFLEWAEVHGNLYGTSRRELLPEGPARGIIFDIDHQGARQIKSKVIGAVTVFILPPSMETLWQRLKGRATDDADSVRRRFEGARAEIEHYGLFDYVIVNHDLEDATEKLKAIFLAEECRRERVAHRAEALLARSPSRATPSKP